MNKGLQENQVQAIQMLVNVHEDWTVSSNDILTKLEERKNQQGEIEGYQVRNERTKKEFFLSIQDMNTLLCYNLERHMDEINEEEQLAEAIDSLAENGCVYVLQGDDRYEVSEADHWAGSEGMEGYISEVLGNILYANPETVLRETVGYLTQDGDKVEFEL